MANANRKFKDQRTLIERRHAKAIEALQSAEENLARAMTRWQKARIKLKRYDRLADKLLAGTADWTELAKSAEQIEDTE
jgi:phage shock protein A